MEKFISFSMTVVVLLFLSVFLTKLYKGAFSPETIKKAMPTSNISRR